MERSTLLAAVFIAIVSVFLFSGQRQRTVVLPQQPQQRQPAPAQRQVTPPKPAVTSAPPAANPVLPAAKMPHLFWLPEDIKFPEGSSRTVTLLGDPRAEGLYVTRTLISKGTRGIPHTHPDSRTIVVLAGTYYYGLGETFDENRMTAMPPGSFLTEPADVPHFTWAKDNDVIIQTTAIGPSGTQIIPDKK